MPVQSCPHPVAVMQMYYFIIMKGSKGEWLLNGQILKALSHSRFPVYTNSLLSSSVIPMNSCQHSALVVQIHVNLKSHQLYRIFLKFYLIYLNLNLTTV